MERDSREVTPEELAFRQAVCRRDPDAWRRLDALYSFDLKRQARLLLAEGFDPENAAAEVWVRAYRRANSYDPTRSPYPWLAKICVNVCINVLRRPRLVLFRGLFDFGRSAKPEPEVEGASDLIHRALSELTPRLQEAVTLRYLFGVSSDEIAALLRIRKESVEINVVRGLQRLRLGRYAEALRALVSGSEGAHS